MSLIKEEGEQSWKLSKQTLMTNDLLKSSKCFALTDCCSEKHAVEHMWTHCPPPAGNVKDSSAHYTAKWGLYMVLQVTQGAHTYLASHIHPNTITSSLSRPEYCVFLFLGKKLFYRIYLWRVLKEL